MSLYEQARKFRAQGRSSKALDFYERALLLEPGHVEARFEHAGLLAEGGKTKEALSEYEEVIRKRPDWAAPHQAAGWIYGMRLREFSKGLAHLERAVELAPQDPNAWYALGGLYQTAGLADKAIPAFKHSIAKGTDQYIRKDATRRVRKLTKAIELSS